MPSFDVLVDPEIFVSLLDNNSLTFNKHPEESGEMEVAKEHQGDTPVVEFNLKNST